jgi:hypothetical protein
VPRLGQLLSREPHLTGRYLNLLFFARLHAPGEWTAFLHDVDPQTRAELETLGARSAHTEAPVAARTLKEAFRPARPWQDDAGTVAAAVAAMLSGGLLAASAIVTEGGLRQANAGVLAVDAVLALGLLVAGPATIRRRAPGWAAITALTAAALAGWTQLTPVIDLKVGYDSLGLPVDPLSYPLAVWLAQAAAVVALGAAACLSVCWRQQPVTTDRHPSARSRLFAAGTMVGGGLIVAASFRPWYGLDYASATLWQAQPGILDGVTVALGGALAAAGAAGVAGKVRGLPWLTAILGCVAFGVVFTPSDLGAGPRLEAGWWLGLTGAGVALACAVLCWLTAGSRPALPGATPARAPRGRGPEPVSARF